MRADSTIAIQFQAIDIAKGYFLGRGYRDLQTNALIGRHIHQLIVSGERRPLVLANRAIAMVEKELLATAKAQSMAGSAAVIEPTPSHRSTS
jgi:hypothetical protein